MQNFAQYAPSPLDPKGANLPDRGAWLVAPLSRDRTSGDLAESNFAVGLAMLGGEGPDVEVHRFQHWGPGWVEAVIVRPGTVAAAKAERLEEMLAAYPALDDTDFSERENDRYVENWNDWGKRDFIDGLVAKFDLTDDEDDVLAAASDEVVRKFYEAHVQERAIDGSPDVNAALRVISEDDVQAFLEARAVEVEASGPAPR